MGRGFPSPPTTVRDVTRGGSSESGGRGWASPCPDPRPASSPNSLGQGQWPSDRRLLGERCVQVFKHSCQGSNTHPASCRHQGPRQQLWTRVAHSYFQYFKQLQGRPPSLPHPKVIQLAKGCSPRSRVTLAGLLDTRPTARETFVSQCSHSKPSQVPCPKQGEANVSQGPM